MAVFNIRSPLYVSLEITYDCNNYCSGCINELSLSRLRKTQRSHWRKIIEGIETSAAHIRLTGGEPTLHPEIEEIICCLDDKRIPFVIFTHGRLQNLQRIIPVLKHANDFLGFLISMHGRTAESHENFTNVKHSFQQMLDGLAAIRDAKLPFFTTTVIREEVADDIEAIAEFARVQGAESINFNRYLGVPDGRTSLTDAALRRAIRTVERLRKEMQLPTYIGNCIPQCFEEYEYPEFQISGMTACTVDPEGNIRAGHYPQIFGNILSQPLEEIWRGKSIVRYLDDIPKACKNCIYGLTCPGGSRALANKLGLHQDPLITKPVLRSIVNQIEIPKGCIPSLNSFVKIRDEDFGCIIYDLNTMYPITVHKNYIDELFLLKQPIETLMKLYGKHIAYIMAGLYRAGLIKFN